MRFHISVELTVCNEDGDIQYPSDETPRSVSLGLGDWESDQIEFAFLWRDTIRVLVRTLALTAQLSYIDVDDF